MAEPHDAQTPPEPLGTVDPHLAYTYCMFPRNFLGGKQLRVR
jgi:hypothetical protein